MNVFWFLPTHGDSRYLGTAEGATWPVTRCTLVPGSRLVLYTDGLVERRDQLFDTGVERLRGALAELRTASVEELCDGVLARLVPDGAEDDVALVAVRLSGPRER